MLHRLILHRLPIFFDRRDPQEAHEPDCEALVDRDGSMLWRATLPRICFERNAAMFQGLPQYPV